MLFQAPLTNTDVASLRGSLTTSNGKGSGKFTTSYKRINTATSWQEASLTLGDGVGVDTVIYR